MALSSRVTTFHLFVTVIVLIGCYQTHAQPQLTSFSLDMTPPEQLILEFNAMVDPDTCDGSAITLQGAAVQQPDSIVMFQAANCSYPTGEAGGFSVQVDPLPFDWMSVQGNLQVATTMANTFISLAPNFIQSASGSPSTGSEATDGLQVGTFTSNQNPPSVMMAALFFDGFVGIIFTEAVNPQTVDPTGITINYVNRVTGMPDSLTLSGMANVGLLQDNVGALIRVGFTQSDLNTLKFWSQAPYSINITAGSFTDGNGQMNPAVNGLEFFIVAPDNTFPNLVQFNVDLNVGNIVLTFDEPMDTVTANVSMLRLVRTFDSLGVGYALNDSTLQNPMNLNTVLTVSLEADVLNAVKSDMDLCSVINNCFLATTGMSIADIQGNPLNSSLGIFAPASYKPDSTPPQLITYIVDLNSGLILLEFSEAIDTFDFSPDGITLTDSNRMNPQTLADSEISSTEAFGSIIVVTVEESVLNNLKMFQAGGGILLTLVATVATDLSGNTIDAIDSSAPLTPDAVQPDITAPILVSFELSVPLQRQLILTFNEAVDTSSLILTSISLTFVSPILEEMTYTLTGGSVASGNLGEVLITLSNSDLMQFSDIYNSSYNGGAFRLSVSAGAVSDLFGNSFTGLTRPLTFSNIPQYVDNFLLDLNFGIVTISFTEPVDDTNIVYSSIFLAGELKISPTGYSLNGSSLVSTNINQTIVTLEITRSVLNQIKFDSEVCSDISNCFLFLVPGSFQNEMGDQLFSSPVRIQVNGTLPDETSPNILEYTVNLNDGTLSFSFDEPIDPASFSPSYLTLYDSSFNRSTALEGAVVSSITELNTRMMVDMRTALNMVKLVSAGSSSLNLAVNGSALTDIAGNPISSIPVFSGFQPTRFTIDTNPPRMIDFMARSPESMSFLMVFDEYVSPSSFDVNKLILTLNTDDGEVYTYGPSNFTAGTVSTPVSDTVTYSFSLTDFNDQFDELYTNAFYDGYLALTAEIGLIRDLGSNQLQAIPDPGLLSNNDSMIPDVRFPTLDRFTFDLDAGQIIMTFSENVTLLLVSGQVTLHDAPTNAQNSYTLADEGMSMVSNGVVTLTLSMSDLNAIKNLPGLASSRGNTYLVLTPMFLEDLSGNLLDTPPEPAEASMFISDSTGPTVMTTSFNLDTGSLSITLSEPILSSDIMLDQISLSSTSQSALGTITLTNSVARTTGADVTITLAVDTLNQIKSTPGLCTMSSNCYLYLTSMAFLDFNRNSLAPPTVGFLLASFIPDITPPRLESFNLDLTAGRVSLSFSESILPSSLDVSQISLANAAGDSVALDEGTSASTTSFDSNLNFVLPLSSDDLNQAKLYGVQGAANVYMILTSTAIMDTSSNSITPISSSNPRQVTTLTPDRRRPSLLSFSPGPPDMNRITLRFDEYVNSSTWNGNNAITLTLTTPEGTFSYSNFSEGTLSPDISDVIQYDFGGSMLMTPFSTRYRRAYERGTITLSGAMNLIQDVFGNVLVDLSVPLVYMNVTVESDRPEILAFSFSSITGELVMNFTEEVVVRTVVDNVILQNLPNSPQVVYSLTQQGTVATVGRTVTITLAATDLNAIRSNPMIGTTEMNTYLRLDPDFASDLNNNALLGRSAGLQASSVERQVLNTALEFFDLDMDTGSLAMSFGNDIDVSSIQSTQMTIQNSRDSDTVSYSLSGLSQPEQVTDSNYITISIFESDQNQLKRIPNLATDSTNTFLSYPSSFAQDIQGNPVASILSNDSRPVSMYTPDSTPPMPTRFQLDMNSGLITLSFDEPIDRSSVTPSLLTVQNGFSSATVSYSLTGGTVMGSSPTPSSVDITMTTDDLNAIKSLSNLATATTDSYLALSLGSVSDVTQNSVSEQIIPATTYQIDITPPTLLYFDLDLRSSANAIINLQFDEPMDPNGATTVNGITLQNTSIAALATRTLPLSSTSDLLTLNTISGLQITLRSSYTTRLQSGEDIGGSVNDLYMSLGQMAIFDRSNNPVSGIPPSAAMKVRYIYRNCMDGSYQNLTSGVCVSCSSTCVGGCSGFQPVAGDDGCDMCYVMLTYANGTQDRCIDQTSGCPLGYYDSTIGSPLTNLAMTVCQPCSENCAMCTSDTNCQACSSAFVTSSITSPVIQCLPECNSSSSVPCGSCHPQCDGCTGPANTDCVQCEGDSMAVDQNTMRCVPSCSPQQYLVETSPGSGEYVCRDCHIDCNGCTGPTQAECVKCRTVFELRQGREVCLSSCPSNSFTTPAGECMPCNDQCIGCINGTTNLDCITCAEQSVLVGVRTACIRQCEAGQVYNAASGQCTIDQNTLIIAVVVGVVVAILIIVVLVVIIVSCVIYCRRSGVFDPNKEDNSPVLFIDAKLTESQVPVLNDYESSPL